MMMYVSAMVHTMPSMPVVVVSDTPTASAALRALSFCCCHRIGALIRHHRHMMSARPGMMYKAHAMLLRLNDVRACGGMVNMMHKFRKQDNFYTQHSITVFKILKKLRYKKAF